VRAVVRDEAKGAPWKARGCEVAVADLTRCGPAGSRAGRNRRRVLFSCRPSLTLSPTSTDVRTTIAIIREAMGQARPAKAVVLSTIGADAAQPNLLNALRYLEQALADVDLPITFLRAAWFMENAEWDVASALGAGSRHELSAAARPPRSHGLNPRCRLHRCGLASRDVDRTADR